MDHSAFQVGEDPWLGWFKSWTGSDYSEPLEPEGWFEEGHLPGVHTWSPPPAAALIVLKEMVRSRLKRMWTTTHVVVRSMIHNYLEVRNMLDRLIRPSKAC